MNREEKNRYLFYNDEGKILVFFTINPHFAKMYLPGKFINFTDSQKFKKKIEKIKDDLMYIYTLNYKYKRFHVMNGKLKPLTVEVEKNFYSYYVDNREFFYEIYSYFKEYNFACELLTIDEIMAMNESDVFIDSGMKEATNILSKKLT